MAYITKGRIRFPTKEELDGYLEKAGFEYADPEAVSARKKTKVTEIQNNLPRYSLHIEPILNNGDGWDVVSSNFPGGLELFIEKGKVKLDFAPGIPPPPYDY